MDQSPLTEHARRTGEAQLSAYEELEARLKHDRPTLQKLADLQAEEERVLLLQTRIDQLRALQQTQKDALTEEFIRSQDTAFEGFDWRRALAGARNAEHALSLGIGTYYIALPTAGAEAGVRKFLASDVGKNAAVSATESIVAQWLRAVHLEGEEQRTQLPDGIAERLSLIRQFPTVLLEQLASHCQNMHQWCTLKMERELKNS